MVRNVQRRFRRKQRRAKQVDRVLVSLVQSVCISVGILLLVKTLSFSSPSTSIICIACLICCLLGFYNPRRVIREFKQWKKWMNRCQVLFNKAVTAASNFKLNFQSVDSQSTTRLLKRKMKKFNLSVFKN